VSGEPTGPRIPLILTEGGANAEIFAASGQRGEPHDHLLRTLGHAPKMLRAWKSLAWALRDDPGLSRAIRELAIMRVAVRKASAYEWNHHWLMATAAGVPAGKLELLADWRSSPVFDEVEREVLAYVDAVVDGPAVPDEVFEPIRSRFEPSAVIELTMTITTYIGIAHFLGAVQIEVEPGVLALVHADATG
jgi:4-carboxymuconolactone decarboxylase